MCRASVAGSRRDGLFEMGSASAQQVQEGLIMKLNVEKHARKFMWALDRGAKTELPKTEDEYIALAASILRQIIRKVLDKLVERGESAEKVW